MKEHKIISIIIGIIVLFLLMVGITAGAFLYKIKYEKKTIDEFSTFDGKYQLTIEQIGEPDWPFGYTHCRFVLKQGEDVITSYSFDLADDGANASSSNFELYFLTDSAQIFVNASEQEKKVYRLYFDGKTEENYVFPEVKIPDSSDFNTADVSGTENNIENDTESDTGRSTENSDSELYDNDNVLNDYTDQIKKNEYQAIFEYLTREGPLADTTALSNSKIAMDYYYSAKGELFLNVLTYEKEADGEKVKVSQELRYNKQVDNQDEFVYQENYYYENSGSSGDSKILDFFMVDRETLEVTDTGRTYW